MLIYKVFSALLEYPDQELLDNLPEIRTIVKSSAGSLEAIAINGLIDYLESHELTELQVRYVDTFDRAPEHSLHLTYHLFGDESDRNRGPALIDLTEMFKEYGVKIVTNELPDYLPLLLEFASYLEDSEATVFLSDVHKVLSILSANLAKANSPYAALLAILESHATLTRLAA